MSRERGSELSIQPSTVDSLLAYRIQPSTVDSLLAYRGTSHRDDPSRRVGWVSLLNSILLRNQTDHWPLLWKKIYHMKAAELWSSSLLKRCMYWTPCRRTPISLPGEVPTSSAHLLIIKSGLYVLNECDNPPLIEYSEWWIYWKWSWGLLRTHEKQLSNSLAKATAT